jgi:alkanesulfonate monooxygenase SsuD/methylene tetrahydromethanopterin reductase-like flavin-dependent oxidoreductase (luciferase family)
VPIIVGGHSDAAARRAGRIGDGFFPYSREQGRLIGIAREEAQAAGRDPDGLEITASLPPHIGELEDLARLGVRRVLVPMIGAARLDPPVRGPEDLGSWSEIIKRYSDA